MRHALELVITPPAGLEIAALDAIDEIRQAFARGPVETVRGIQGDWWYRRFGVQVQGDGPAAAFRDARSAAGQRYCADPVRLQVSGDAVVLDAGAATDLSPEDATALIALLNRHFAEDGIGFRAIAPDQWLLESATPIDATTFAPESAHARSIETFLPQGPHARRLKQVVNEAQMLFHDCAVNQQRETRGQAPINGLWLWGGTRALAVAAKAPAAKVFSNRLHVLGLAQSAGIPSGPLPASGGDLPHIDGPAMVDLFAAFADPEGWTTWLDEHWVAPLRNRGVPVRLVLDLPAACVSAPMFRGDFWHFLRRGNLASRLRAAGVDL